MGQALNPCAKVDDDYWSSKSTNKSITKNVEQVRKTSANEIKMLLLGAGESGKSTIFKQMKIIHRSGYTTEEKISYKDAIVSNVLTCIKSLISAADKFQLVLDSENKARVIKILECPAAENESLLNPARFFSQELAQDISAVWRDSAIAQVFQRRAEYQLLDSAEYYLNSLDRIGSPEYVPTEEDILRCRNKTTGIMHAEYDYGGLHFKLYDVGGQRSERKKWIHCFQNVSTLIFVASLSEYDQRCYEDDVTPRMKESMLLFEEISNCRWFSKTPIILFLNKVDLFRDKIRKTDLNVFFPDYHGGNDFENGWKFVSKKFSDLNKNENKRIYTHLTCATDTKSIQNVFESVKDIIMQHNLQESGLIGVGTRLPLA